MPNWGFLGNLGLQKEGTDLIGACTQAKGGRRRRGGGWCTKRRPKSLEQSSHSPAPSDRVRSRQQGPGGGPPPPPPPPHPNCRTQGCIRREGPQRRPQRRLEEVAKSVGGGYCRLQMPLRLALGVRGTAAGHRLGALEGGVPHPLPMHPWPYLGECCARGGIRRSRPPEIRRSRRCGPDVFVSPPHRTAFGGQGRRGGIRGRAGRGVRGAIFARQRASPKAIGPGAWGSAWGACQLSLRVGGGVEQARDALEGGGTPPV